TCAIYKKPRAAVAVAVRKVKHPLSQPSTAANPGSSRETVSSPSGGCCCIAAGELVSRPGLARSTGHRAFCARRSDRGGFLLGTWVLCAAQDARMSRSAWMRGSDAAQRKVPRPRGETRTLRPDTRRSRMSANNHITPLPDPLPQGEREKHKRPDSCFRGNDRQEEERTTKRKSDRGETAEQPPPQKSQTTPTPILESKAQ